MSIITREVRASKGVVVGLGEQVLELEEGIMNMLTWQRFDSAGLRPPEQHEA